MENNIKIEWHWKYCSDNMTHTHKSKSTCVVCRVWLREHKHVMPWYVTSIGINLFDSIHKWWSCTANLSTPRSIVARFHFPFRNYTNFTQMKINGNVILFEYFFSIAFVMNHDHGCWMIRLRVKIIYDYIQFYPHNIQYACSRRQSANHFRLYWLIVESKLCASDSFRFINYAQCKCTSARADEKKKHKTLFKML